MNNQNLLLSSFSMEDASYTRARRIYHQALLLADMWIFARYWYWINMSNMQEEVAASCIIHACSSSLKGVSTVYR